MARLPKESRNVLTRYFAGNPDDWLNPGARSQVKLEIAAELGVSVNKVRAIIDEAKEQLREAIEEYERNPRGVMGRRKPPPAIEPEPGDAPRPAVRRWLCWRGVDPRTRRLRWNLVEFSC